MSRLANLASFAIIYHTASLQQIVLDLKHPTSHQLSGIRGLGTVIVQRCLPADGHLFDKPLTSERPQPFYVTTIIESIISYQPPLKIVFPFLLHFGCRVAVESCFS